MDDVQNLTVQYRSRSFNDFAVFKFMFFFFLFGFYSPFKNISSQSFI